MVQSNDSGSRQQQYRPHSSPSITACRRGVDMKWKSSFFGGSIFKIDLLYILSKQRMIQGVHTAPFPYHQIFLYQSAQ